MVVLVAYADDIMVFGTSDALGTRLKAMQEHFLLKQIGSLDEDSSSLMFLGRNLLREGSAIHMTNLPGYLAEVYAQLNMTFGGATATPGGS